jgi:hypothetical protein
MPAVRAAVAGLFDLEESKVEDVEVGFEDWPMPE